MMNKVTFQHWLALALLILMLLIVLFSAIVPLVSTGLDYHEQKKELAFRLQRVRHIVAGKDRVIENIERIKQQYQSQNYFSTRNTVALASADLQKFVKSAISQAGGQLISTQVLAGSSENGFNRVTVKVRMSGDIDILHSVLREIETAVPVMIVDQIDIRPVRGKRNRKTRKIEQSNKLNVSFQVVGFMRAKAS